MIFIRNARNRQRSSEKFAPSVGDMTGSQVNFYYDKSGNDTTSESDDDRSRRQ